MRSAIRTLARARNLLAAALAALGVGCGPPAAAPEPGLLTEHPLHLFDHLDDAAVEGAAAALMGEIAPSPERTLLEADFEDGSLAPLTPFAGVGPAAAEPPGFASVVRGPRAFGEGASAALQGGVDHGVSLRTALFPVAPGERYRLRYRVAVEGVRGGRDISFGSASLLLYRIPPKQQAEAAALLADPATEKKLRLRGAQDFRVERHKGSADWSLEETHFTTGPRATHAVLSFDLSRPEDDRSPHRAWGEAWFDEILLTARREPIPPRYRGLDDGAGEPHPLKVGVELGYRPRRHGLEARYGIAAPAPSRLAFRVRVPEAGRLGLGFGLLPEAQQPGAPPVSFVVEVEGEEPEGESRELLRESLTPGDDRWFDAEVDLGAFAGRSVQLTLATEGRPFAEGERPLERLPEAGAVWSYPILHGRDDAGRVIVLLGLDTLAAARTSSYGYAPTTTPRLSAIAAQGWLFRSAFAPSPWTLPSFASLLTGLPPAQHRAGEGLARPPGWRPLGAHFLTVAERLRQAGWETRAWINNPLMTRSFGLHQGFTSYVDYATQGRDEAAAPAVEDVIQELARPRGYDRFLFLHMMDPHGPYRANETFRRRFLSAGYRGPFEAPLDPRRFDRIVAGDGLDASDRRRVVEFYESAIAYTDEQVGRVFEALKAAEPRGEVALVVTSDHGEEFWEHGLFEHGHSLYDELLHVPLVVHATGRTEEPRVVEAQVSVQDVTATLLDLAGIEAPAELPTRSLLREAGDGSDGPRSLVFESMLYGVPRLAVRGAGTKYVYNERSGGIPSQRAPRPANRHELYLLDEDPGETSNVFERELARALPLHEVLARRFVASLDGAYAIRLEGEPDGAGGIRPVRFEGSLTLPPGAVWAPGVREFVWPLPDGGEAEVKFTRRRVGSRHRVEFRVEATRALIAFTPRPAAGAVELDLRRDGRRLDPGQVGLGGAGHPGALPARVEDDALSIAPEALLARAAGGPRALLGRVVAAPGGSGPAEVSDETRRQLEALGYVPE